MDTSSNSGNKPKLAKGLAGKLGFYSGRTFGGFIAVVLSGQLFYTCLQALRGPFYNQLLQMLHVNNTQFGMLFTITSISSFLTIPGGWVMNRYSVKSILITCLSIRFLTILLMVYGHLNVTGLYVLAAFWALIQSVFFPSVLNGVALLSNKDNKSTAFGILESARRLLQMVLDWILIGVIAWLTPTFGEIPTFQFMLLIYDLLLIPLIFLIAKYVPKNGIAAEEKGKKGKGVDALAGLGKVLIMPKLWIAALTALTIYWLSLQQNYAVPFLQNAMHVNKGAASFFGTISSEGIGIIAALLSGILADKWLHSTSKMIMVGLALVLIASILEIIMSKTPAMGGWMMAIIAIQSFGMFTAKGVYMVPASKVPMPEKYRGGAMSVNSFVAYLPNLFALTWVGHILDSNKPVAAYNQIWTISAIVAAAGFLLAMFTLRDENKQKKAKATAATK